MAGLAGAALIISGAGAAAADPIQTPAPTPSPAQADIEQAVVDAVEEDGTAAFWVRFDARPDMSQFSAIEDWDQRGQAVFDALQETAEKSQAETVEMLKDRHVPYQAFYATNAIKVTGDADLLDDLAATTGVEGIYAPTEILPPDPETVEEPTANVTADGVEWGVADINADDVWSELGVHGEGIVIANIDTGVQYDHPALVNSYRGNNGNGTFTHDYNWFDAAGTGSPFPADDNGHGTHTMGSMVGDDNGENKIGVAPGATWIAANGCCPSDDALIASAEWMLAPTRMDGSAPDPGKRPHIINNSWGTSVPSNEPFMEDLIEAWDAAGIFSMWANGNEGPACETSGAPGSRIITYSVGNYDSDHAIAPSSSKGAGQDGEIKPNISAPGTNIRSSLPGSDYGNATGTSMASPHAAAAVALLWSAAPGMTGDIQGTRDLLDGSAIDTEDLTCGGTAGKNNVFGEGRLDALQLILDAPATGVGTLSGTVQDTSGEPVVRATVSIVGPGERTLSTDEAGAYTARLEPGEYSVTVSSFGYVTESATVQVPDGDVVHDVVLESAPTVTFSGTVTDGSGGRGLPLYAKVDFASGQTSTFTDPSDGSFSIEVPANHEMDVRVQAQVPGYETAYDSLELAGDEARDYSLSVDALACTAPGYVKDEAAVMSQTFDDTTVPEGWSVEDLADTGAVWTFDEGVIFGNNTGGEGNLAAMNAFLYQEEGINDYDTALVAPAQDFSGTPVLTFANERFIGSDSVGTVETSTDGGSTWDVVASYPGERMDTGPMFTTLPLADLAGESDVQVRFRYVGDDVAPGNDLGWWVDNVLLEDVSCTPGDTGGYVFGTVTDQASGDPMNGAVVASVEEPRATGTARPTPADESQDDGFYLLYSTLVGVQPFEATVRHYDAATKDVDVADAQGVRADFTVGGNVLVSDPDAVETQVELGEADTVEVTVTNTGSSVADVEFAEFAGTVSAATATDDTLLPTAQMPSLTANPDVADQPVADGPDASSLTSDTDWDPLTDYPIAVRDAGVEQIDGIWYAFGGSLGTDGATDRAYQYDPSTTEWSELPTMPVKANAMATGVIDGQIVVTGGWLPEGRMNTTTMFYDPVKEQWSTGPENPSPRAAAGSAVLDGRLVTVGGCADAYCDPAQTTVTAYDPELDTWTELADYPEIGAFYQCGAIDGLLYCVGGTDELVYDTAYVYDPATDSWDSIPDAPRPVYAAPHGVANGMLVVAGGATDGALSLASWAYDPGAGQWVDLPNVQDANYRGGGVCGFGYVGGANFAYPVSGVHHLSCYDDCGMDPVDVPWLELDIDSATLQPGASVTVEVTTDSAELEDTGTYQAGLRIKGGALGSDSLLPVTMEVIDEQVIEHPEVTRHAGEDRYATAVNLSGAYEPGVDVAFIASGQDYPDALSVSALAGSLEAPVLLTRPDHLPQSTMAELGRLRPEQVVVLGGPVAVSDTVVSAIDAASGDAAVERYAGDDRYGTAARVAQEFDTTDVVYVASGENFPDALAVAAAAGRNDAPLLLVKADHIPVATAGQLDRLGPDRIVVVGGDEVIGGDVEATLDQWAPVDRFAGGDRYETASLLAGELSSAEQVFVASGTAWPDALTGAARAGAVDAPLLLTQFENIPNVTWAELERLAPMSVALTGGLDVISQHVEDLIGELELS